MRVPAGGGPLRTLKPPAPLTITAGPREAPEQEVTMAFAGRCRAGTPGVILGRQSCELWV